MTELLSTKRHIDSYRNTLYITEPDQTSTECNIYSWLLYMRYIHVRVCVFVCWVYVRICVYVTCTLPLVYEMYHFRSWLCRSAWDVRSFFKITFRDEGLRHAWISATFVASQTIKIPRSTEIYYCNGNIELDICFCFLLFCFFFCFFFCNLLQYAFDSCSSSIFRVTVAAV